MATKKKTSSKTLTSYQFSKLQDISERLNQIKYLLESQKGEENISSIMFDIGAATENVNWCEDKLNSIICEFDDTMAW